MGASGHSARRLLFAHLKQVTQMSAGMVFAIIITVLLLWLVIGGMVAALLGPLIKQAASRVPPSRDDRATFSELPPGQLVGPEPTSVQPPPARARPSYLAPERIAGIPAQRIRRLSAP